MRLPLSCHRKLHCAVWIVLASAILGAAGCFRRGSEHGEVWARVDGVPIYRDQVEAEYMRQTAMLPGPNRTEQALSFKLAILNQLIDRQLLLERASRLQITATSAEVNTEIARIRSPHSPADFRKRLASQGVTLAALRAQVRDNIVLNKLIQQEITSRVSVTPQEIANYYARNKLDFNVPQAEVHLAEIVVTPVVGPQVNNLMNDDARNNAEARRKVKSLYALLRSGENFAKVAEEYSEDPHTTPGGGDMGFVPVSSLASDRAVSAALKPLRVGQISGILHDRSGYRIIKLLGRVPAGERPLSDPEVRQSIRQTLTDEAEEALKAAYIENLRNNAHVVDFLAQQIVQKGGSAHAVH